MKNINFSKKRFQEVCVTDKLRGKDIVCIKGVRKRINDLIKTNPLELWNEIHKEGSNISLVRTTYAELKKAVYAIDRTLVDIADIKHDNHVSIRKFLNEKNNGILGTSRSNFRKIGERLKK